MKLLMLPANREEALARARANGQCFERWPDITVPCSIAPDAAGSGERLNKRWEHDESREPLSRFLILVIFWCFSWFFCCGR
jgi:hypothetical protein